MPKQPISVRIQFRIPSSHYATLRAKAEAFNTSPADVARGVLVGHLTGDGEGRGEMADALTELRNMLATEMLERRKQGEELRVLKEMLSEFLSECERQ